MKAIVALILLGVVALSYAGALTTAGVTYTAAPFGYSTVAAGPLAYTAGALPLPYAGYYPGFGYSGYSGNYQLKLDTTLPGSAYVGSYPYGAAPTAYGYGVLKTL